MKVFEKGEAMLAQDFDDFVNVTEGKRYDCLYGTETRGWSDHWYVTIVDDTGDQFSCRQSRFREFKL